MKKQRRKANETGETDGLGAYQNTDILAMLHPTVDHQMTTTTTNGNYWLGLRLDDTNFSFQSIRFGQSRTNHGLLLLYINIAEETDNIL